MTTLDLNLLPLIRQGGQDQADWPGLYAVTPPRRTARGRGNDKLILYLQLAGSGTLSQEQQTQLLVQLAQTYYKTSGTVTAALRATAEFINQALLERNVRNSNSGRQEIGFFTQVVVREEMIYLAQSGPGHAFLLRPQAIQHYFDPQGAGRGLGLSRTTAVRYFQVTLQTGDFLLLAHRPAEAWLAEGGPPEPGQGMEGMRRRLLQQAGEDLNAVLVQAQAGTGRMRLLRLKPAFQNMARPAAPAAEKPASDASPLVASPEPEGTDGAESAGPEESSSPGETLNGAQDEQPSAVDGIAPDQPEGAQPIALASVIQLPSGLEGQPEQAQPLPSLQTPPPVEKSSTPRLSRAAVKERSAPAGTHTAKVKPAKRPGRVLPAIARFFSMVFKALGAFGSSLGSALQQVFEGLRGLLRRILPDESLLNVSQTTRIIFALAIPIVIGVVGGVVYIERGQEQQYQAYYQQAFQAVEGTAAKTDPVALRAAWQVALENLDQAELYKQTEQSQALRAQARGQLDHMDAVERLDFLPALSESLEKSVQITRMIATTNELYMLNSAQGNIMRALLTSSGYNLDRQFSCGPAVAPGSIGPLVALAALPGGHPDGATVVGMDLSGNLIYCIPGDDPKLASLAPPPVNFGNPKSFTVDSGNLYLIDPPKKSVWIYRDMVTDQPPHQFLGNITSFMVDVVDLAANLDDVYLLHSNGRVTKCTYGRIENVPTRCEDPLPFTDPRPGRQGGEIIPDALFNQVYFSPPPDPSLYMLDPRNQAIYHFSLRLTLDRQYRSLRLLPAGSATAFAVSPTRMIFIAIGNEIFYAALP